MNYCFQPKIVQKTGWKKRFHRLRLETRQLSFLKPNETSHLPETVGTAEREVSSPELVEAEVSELKLLEMVGLGP
jgi:hypothetical protein